VTRPSRVIFRALFVASIAMAVFASPVLSARACARACAAPHEESSVAPASKACCATKHAQDPSEHRHKKSDGKRDCGACVSACCRTVTALDEHHATELDETPALSIEPAPLAVRDFVPHNPIFHPPRA
jgi:hypothetical protein